MRDNTHHVAPAGRRIHDDGGPTPSAGEAGRSLHTRLAEFLAARAPRLTGWKRRPPRRRPIAGQGSHAA